MKKDLSSSERRTDMLIFMNEVRETHYRDLSKIYGVSAPTIKKDLDYLESVFSVPLIRIGGNGGSVKVMDDWHFHFKVLTVEQVKTLIEVIAQTDDENTKKILLSIIRDFSNYNIDVM